MKGNRQQATGEEHRQQATGERQRWRTKAALAAVFIFAFCLLPVAFSSDSGSPFTIRGSGFSVRALAQAGRRTPGSETKKNTQEKPPEAKTPETPAPKEPEGAAEDVDEGETVKVETNLVTVPVVASDREGRYVPDLKAEEFSVSEDGTEQRVAFFATVTEPFSVVLLIDTSASTTVEKMRQVQDAAIAFTEQLRTGDRMKVVSFDDEVRDLCDFTADRGALASAIRSTRPGKGTRLYDAFDLAFRSLRRLKGRKAVIMLTDGVDFHSERRTYEDNRRAVEESDVIVYPVRFDTRAETEQLARQQARGGQPVDLGTILGKIPGMPPGTVVINPRGRSGSDPNERRPAPSSSDGSGMPDVTARSPDERIGGNSGGSNGSSSNSDASIAAMLDNLYRLADDYLNELAQTTGGRLVRADNPSMLPRAFQQIADELRTQYSLGYYPANTTRDGKYRKLRVRTTRKNVALRTRPGYRARK
jgi:VWFA-related protein